MREAWVAGGNFICSVTALLFKYGTCRAELHTIAGVPLHLLQNASTSFPVPALSQHPCLPLLSPQPAPWLPRTWLHFSEYVFRPDLAALWTVTSMLIAATAGGEIVVFVTGLGLGVFLLCMVSC